MTIASTLQITPSSCQFQKKINKKIFNHSRQTKSMFKVNKN